MSEAAKSPPAIHVDLGAIFVSMELSRSIWLITSLSPGKGEKMSKRQLRAGDTGGLFEVFRKLQDDVRVRTGRDCPIVTIQEAGLDGFWIHRVLRTEGIESHIVDPASVAISRRHRRAKTDGIDGEALLRVLMAYKRGEPRVCSMLRVPAPDEEDRRRIGRERKILTAERISHVNRIKGLLFSQGISDYEPLPRDRRQRLEALRTGDGCALAPQMKAQIERELDRLELVLAQIRSVEKARDAQAQQSSPEPAPINMLLGIRGSGQSLRMCCGRSACFDISTTAGRSRPMPGWHLRHGKAAR